MHECGRLFYGDIECTQHIRGCARILVVMTGDVDVTWLVTADWGGSSRIGRAATALRPVTA
jgi:hypothetical protein